MLVTTFIVILSEVVILTSGDDQEQRSYDGYRVVRSVAKTAAGQAFIERELQRNGEECNVWKAPQKY